MQRRPPVLAVGVEKLGIFGDELQHAIFPARHAGSEYVQLDASHAQVADRLMMAGLNHEATEPHGKDWAINLEVTSNRPDCLGHIGIAREVSVLWNRPLKLPPADPREGSTAIASQELQIERFPGRRERRV